MTELAVKLAETSGISESHPDAFGHKACEHCRQQLLHIWRQIRVLVCKQRGACGNEALQPARIPKATGDAISNELHHVWYQVR